MDSKEEDRNNILTKVEMGAEVGLGLEDDPTKTSPDRKKKVFFNLENLKQFSIERLRLENSHYDNEGECLENMTINSQSSISMDNNNVKGIEEIEELEGMTMEF